MSRLSLILSPSVAASLVAISGQKAMRQGPVEATIVEGQTPRWHIVETHPGQDKVAVAHLAGRRFGVFWPSFTIDVDGRFGKKRTHIKALFGGYVFVFVWDIAAHARRILSCPGVRGIVYGAGGAAIVPDQFIAHLRIREVYEQDQIEVSKKRKRPRRKRSSPIEHQDDMISIRPFDVLHGIETLDDEKRRAVLMRALGLAS